MFVTYGEESGFFYSPSVGARVTPVIFPPKQSALRSSNRQLLSIGHELGLGCRLLSNPVEELRRRATVPV